MDRLENHPQVRTDYRVDLGPGGERYIAFRSIKQAVSYCGLCRDEKSLADEVMRTPISKRRNKHIQAGAGRSRPATIDNPQRQLKRLALYYLFNQPQPIFFADLHDIKAWTEASTIAGVPRALTFLTSRSGRSHCQRLTRDEADSDRLRIRKCKIVQNL